MSDFVAYCVAREVSGRYRQEPIPPANNRGRAAADDWFERLGAEEELSAHG